MHHKHHLLHPRGPPGWRTQSDYLGSLKSRKCHQSWSVCSHCMFRKLLRGAKDLVADWVEVEMVVLAGAATRASVVVAVED